MKPKFTFQLTRYIEKLIVESENLEERVCVIIRTLEIMSVLQELHNFNGVMALTSGTWPMSSQLTLIYLHLEKMTAVCLHF